MLAVTSAGDGTAAGCGASTLCVDDDWEYRQALIEAGVDPDDPRIRRAMAEVAACLGRIGHAERI
ncbi:hypothetical protein CH263_08200 [Rhodococcus sp. 06-1059B-a]|nr:hypothetical protein CH263_08200 [Rhodococcus sp. 06-1059B-a]